MEAAAPGDDRKWVKHQLKHQRTYEHWVKGVISLGTAAVGCWMFKISVFPNGKSLVEELGNPEANHDALKHDLLYAMLATAGGILAMSDGYRVDRKDAAEKKAD